MLYKIDWIERSETSTGKKKAEATLTGEDKVSTTVTIWGDFPNFATLMPGTEVEGDIVPAKDPKYKPSLNVPRAPRASNSGFKQMQIEKTMEAKNSAIRGFQDVKEHSIKVSSTFRAAVDTAIAEYQEQKRLSVTGPSMEDLFKKWRDYYWKEFDVNPLDHAAF